MNMKDVKAITIPQGSVKKIEDSNGNIIWGSYDAFPYRRLEYIKFSGTEYVNTNTSLPSGTTYKRLDLRLSLQKTNGWGTNGYDSNTNKRFFMGLNNSNNARFAAGSGSGNSSGWTLSTDYIYNWTLWFNNGSTNMTIADNTTGTELWKSSTLSVTFSAAPGNLYIGALNYDGNISNYTQEKIYYVRIASNSFSGRLFNGIPVQRKSDKVCGLYDTQNNVFRPMIGTNITDAAAGPIIDEYWNLQE